MGPSKRKGLVRRQVLNLNSKEDIPQISAWQTKYQSVLPDEEVFENGDSQSTSATSTNPLSGLLGNYNSDSDSEEPKQKITESLDAKVEDFLKEIQSISAETTSQSQAEPSLPKLSESQDRAVYLPLIGWQQCYDHNSGYPYYWNTETNEVTWEMPTELKAAIEAVGRENLPQLQPQTKIESSAMKKVCDYSQQTIISSEKEKEELVMNSEEKNGSINKEIHNPGSKTPQPNVKIKGKDIKLAPEDPEAMNEFTYETSSLLAHGVQDTGPPGDESFQTVKPTKMFVVKKEEPKNENCIVETCLSQDKPPGQLRPEKPVCEEEWRDFKPENKKIEVDSIAQIKAESPNDYGVEILDLPTSKTTGIALIANYGDDSEPEDNTCNEKQETNLRTTKQLFPIDIPQEKKIPLFPCLGIEVPKVEMKSKELFQDEPDPSSGIYNSEFEDPSVQKAFKRKRRIEFATIAYGSSSNKSSDKSIEQPIAAPSTQYNMDPDENEHRGFGFNAQKAPVECEKKVYKNFGGIQFIKAETINLREQKEAETELDDGSFQKGGSEALARQEEIEYAASLLKEKVTFLTAGTGSISAIQQMAIELETLVVAWKDGALTPPYLLRWLNNKCSEITRHEKSAAPSGWTCFWDRKTKRYSYRNSTTKEIQWEYPTAQEKTKGKDGEVLGAGDEMDICDTPPHLSPLGSEKQTDERPSTPPPPAISSVPEIVSPQIFTPQPPSPPQISLCEEEVLKKKKKRKIEETEKIPEDEGVSAPTPSDPENEQNENKAPPLPPIPSPPPPPPEESPPPLPESPPPPPLPVEPDQPLPPGVDEPECSFYRTPKHSYKKTQAETAAFSTELMMPYGFGLPVQQVVSSNGQAITMQMQPIEYHTYMQDTVSNSYIVQPGLTSHVIHCSAKKPKPSLTSELVSFYTDLAKMDNSGENCGPNVEAKSIAAEVSQERLPSPPAHVPLVTPAPKPTCVKSSAVFSSASCKVPESLPSNGVNVKKKKKVKTAAGLSLKKKGVSSLVAKWQQVQQEVRRDFSDDDDDIVPK